nr:MAG TPA: hypothetical protein [Caudoviricetes sp.]
MVRYAHLCWYAKYSLALIAITRLNWLYLYVFQPLISTLGEDTQGLLA